MCLKIKQDSRSFLVEQDNFKLVSGEIFNIF